MAKELAIPPIIPKEVKDRALELYLSGTMGNAEIAEAATVEFGIEVTTGRLISWIKEEDWRSLKVEARNRVLAKLVDENQESLLQDVKDQVESYRKVTKKAEEALTGENALEFEKAGDAVQALDIGIKGQRKVMQGVLSLQFLTDVLNVIAEEVHDDAILSRIAIRFKRLAASLVEEG